MADYVRDGIAVYLCFSISLLICVSLTYGYSIHPALYDYSLYAHYHYIILYLIEGLIVPVNSLLQACHFLHDLCR